MTWIIWAFLLLSHGAFTRWSKSARRYAQMSIVSDVLLLTIGLITVDQLQGMPLADIARIGLFFIAFGTAGRYLMGSMLSASAKG